MLRVALTSSKCTCKTVVVVRWAVLSGGAFSCAVHVLYLFSPLLLMLFAMCAQTHTPLSRLSSSFPTHFDFVGS